MIYDEVEGIYTVDRNNTLDLVKTGVVGQCG